MGSEANCASAMLTLNTAVAEALTNFKERVDKKISEYSQYSQYSEGTGHTAKFHALLDVLREDIRYIRPIRFDGNGYSDEWKQEAKRRGLDCETSCPLIYDRYLDEDTVRMFESQKVMTRHELKARNEIKWETYTKKIQIEARVFGDLCMNHVIPVVTKYQSVLIDNVHKLKEIFTEEKAMKIAANNLKLIEEISEHESFIIEHVNQLIEAKIGRASCRERV